MNRRGFFGMIPAAAVGAAIKTAPETPNFLGPMGVAKWVASGYIGTYRVLLDGVDITDRCKFFNDRKGYALVYRLKDGHPFVTSGYTVATERLFGKIQIVKAREA